VSTRLNQIIRQFEKWSGNRIDKSRLLSRPNANVELVTAAASDKCQGSDIRPGSRTRDAAK
jgi:hypothetical protein